ncbi:cation transporter [Meridianimarinicoccus sp. RP-17]|uniref:cation transporter n=1 Tax=Meridianimarinicoccus zhengii TaxID=2056810 RepID=UPI000DAD6430|nr:cation transporter [Phycocomes zhengii]
MTGVVEEAARRLENRSLALSMWGNVFMGLAGLVAGMLANSNAIMLDGLFSLIGFAAALLGRRVSRRVADGPDKLRPLGYAADEAIFSTFRALSLLGVVLFAASVAVKNIYNYAIGIAPAPLHFGPMMVYFGVVGATCFLLWAAHRHAWRKTGRVSEILKLEGKAALFDGIITAAAGVGMAAIFVWQDSVLAPIVPIGDSIILLLLCLAATGTYMQDFREGLGQLAGVTASPDSIAAARRAIRPALADDGGKLTDVSVQKTGRAYLVTVYYDPLRAITAAEIDRLNLRLIADVRQVLPGADVFVLVTEFTRRWPDDLDPG